MHEPSVVIRYMDLFHPIDAPEGGDAYAHFADATRGFTEELGCRDAHPSDKRKTRLRSARSMICIPTKASNREPNTHLPVTQSSRFAFPAVA